jgi:hypothetical protein
MVKKWVVLCKCPKSDITSMTEAFFGLKPGTLSEAPRKEGDDYEGDRTAADYADSEPNVSPHDSEERTMQTITTIELESLELQ